MADRHFSEYGRPRAKTILSKKQVARRSYESDSISIKSYEEGIVEDYDRFHDKCDENIHLSSERLVATRNPDCFGGKVFSAKPITLGGTFSVKLLEKEKVAYNGCLAIGFTSRDPDTLNLSPSNDFALRQSPDCWFFSDDTLYHNGNKRKLKISTQSLREGDSVGCRVTSDGDLELYMTDEKRVVGWRKVPTDKPLWGVVCIYGQAKTIQLDFYCEPAILGISKQQMKTLEQRDKQSVEPQSGSQTQKEVSKIRQQNQEQASQINHMLRVQKEHTSQIEQIQKEHTSQIEQIQKEHTSQIEQIQKEHTSRIEQIQKEHTSQIEQIQKEHTSQFRRLQQEHTSQLGHLQEEMTTHFQHQLEEQKRLIQEEMQQQFQAQLVPLQSRMQNLQPSWSIDQEHIEITEHVLGRGAYGEVRVGIYQGTRVAVKKIHEVIISDYNRELFEREMKIASRVRHPNLLLFVGAVTIGKPIIVSELIDTSLRKVMEEGNLKLPDIHPISEDVACALIYLHSLPDPIVHRDVRCANVLLNAKKDGWQAKLGDFGSANFLAKLGTVGPGCVAYAAPEAVDPRQQSPKMDVYSFGVLLLEMCAGKFMDQDTLESTKVAVVTWSDPSKKSLGEWSKRCTERDPDKRPNMADFIKLF